ncbi:MAG: aminotransferase class V-fold PLP-dependent enzyme [Clostridia bacterium]|nr:aminotransferase class V-fold PLP-dependent enzyme [Clostridia bacterium]
MIYFDNAATGGFKPYQVLETTETVMKYLCANPVRSGHRLALTGAEIIFNCRKNFSEYLNAPLEKIIFTKNCTEALNIAILGTALSGGHVITTVYEHNSVLRPLSYLREKGIITFDVVAPSDTHSLTENVLSAVKSNTYMIIHTLASNVTGETFDVKKLGEFCKVNNILLLCDGAQAGGHIKTDMRENNISMLALAGHKGLCGIMGSGVLAIAENVSPSPVMFGGTGTESFNLAQPTLYPERLESGTPNLPAIASLNEGLSYVSKNQRTIKDVLFSHTKYLIEKLSDINKITVYSKPNPVGIVSFSVDGKDSNEIAERLDKEYDIAVRSGLHCAPLCHKYLGTEKEGLIRVSFSVFNSTREINFLCNALNKIIG